jgi:peptide chain release factor 2
VEKAIAEKEALTASPGFWDDQKKAGQVMTAIKALKQRVEPWRRLVNRINDAEALYDLGMEAGDTSVEAEVKAQVAGIAGDYEKQSLLNLLSG